MSFCIGTFFGYPPCCVDSFLTEHSAMNHVARHEELPFEGSGFIPCVTCFTTKTPAELQAEIASRRECPTPFPDDSGAHAKMQEIMRSAAQADPGAEVYRESELA